MSSAFDYRATPVCTDVRFARNAFKVFTRIALPDNEKPNLRILPKDNREGKKEVLDALVFLEASKVPDDGDGRFLNIPQFVKKMVNAIVNQKEVLVAISMREHLFSCALGNDCNGNPLIHGERQPFTQGDVQGWKKRHLIENGFAKKMVNDSNKRPSDVQWSEKGDLIQVVHNDVKPFATKVQEITKRDMEVECCAAAAANHPDPVDEFFP